MVLPDLSKGGDLHVTLVDAEARVLHGYHRRTQCSVITLFQIRKGSGFFRAEVIEAWLGSGLLAASL